jgi:hypothetical protein
LANKEIRIPHSEIDSSDKITDATIRHFEKHGLDIHKHEVVKLTDDFNRKERILEIHNRQFFVIGDVPWHRK